MSKEELYFSVDIECDGPIPGPYSMLSFACVVLDEKGQERRTFERNLETLAGATTDPSTDDFWKRFPEAYEATRVDTVTPEDAMCDFTAMVRSFQKQGYGTVMVCAPSGFDFTFMYWYMVQFTKDGSPFGFNAIDMRTFVMAMRNKTFFRTGKRYWPKRWFPEDMPHTHVAIDDAREQGHTFINMLKELRGRDGEA